MRRLLAAIRRRLERPTPPAALDFGEGYLDVTAIAHGQNITRGWQIQPNVWTGGGGYLPWTWNAHGQYGWLCGDSRTRDQAKAAAIVAMDRLSYAVVA